MAWIEVIKRGITDGAEKDRRAGLTRGECLVGEGHAMAAKRVPPNRMRLAVKFVPAGLADELQDSHRLCRDLGSNAVSGQHGNRQAHERSS